MPQVTILVGPAGSGKTHTALKLAKGKKALWIYDTTEIEAQIRTVLQPTDAVIVIEGVRVFNEMDLTRIKMLCTLTAFEKKNGQEMIVPPIIMTVQCPIAKLPEWFKIRNRVDVIECTHTYA